MSNLPSRFYRPTLNLTDADSAEIIAAYTVYKPVNVVQNDSESTEDFDDPNDFNDYFWESDNEYIEDNETWSFDKLK